jgi:hypothetical protein
MANLIAGVGTVSLFDTVTNALILTSKTLTDEGFNFSSSAEEARGGMGNALLGKYYHDTAFSLTLTDQLFDMQYLALNCGGAITAGADTMTNEQVVITTNGVITVTRTPVAFNNKTALWYKKSTEPDSAYKMAEVVGRNANVNGVKADEVYCVKYCVNDASARRFMVNTAYIPSIVHAIATFPLFKSGSTDVNVGTSSSQIGYMQVDIPNFQLNGSQELALTSGGIAKASLSGSALATYSGNSGCSENGYYAIVSEHIYNKEIMDDVASIVVFNSDIDLVTGETQPVKVYGLFSNGTQPMEIDNSKLTFVSNTQSVATVDASGIVTAVAEGISTIEVTVTNKPSLTAYAVVTVTSAS